MLCSILLQERIHRMSLNLPIMVKINNCNIIFWMAFIQQFEVLLLCYWLHSGACPQRTCFYRTVSDANKTDGDRLDADRAMYSSEVNNPDNPLQFRETLNWLNLRHLHINNSSVRCRCTSTHKMKQANQFCYREKTIEMVYLYAIAVLINTATKICQIHVYLFLNIPYPIFIAISELISF